MKTNFTFSGWLTAIIITICSPIAAFSQVPVTDLSMLKAGATIKIYPKDFNGRSRVPGGYISSSIATSSYAISCSGEGKELTSSSEGVSTGDTWTLIDAGDGCFYLKNDLGCYWAYQGKKSDQSMTCVADINSAVKVRLSWNPKSFGINFWNKNEDTMLNNLNYGALFNWWVASADDSWKTCDYDKYFDVKTTFEIVLLNDAEGEYPSKEIIVDNIKYLVDIRNKTAQVLTNKYSGDIVIPEKITNEGTDYMVTSLGDRCFTYSSVTSITLPKGITVIGPRRFNDCSNLKSITFPKNLKTIGLAAFKICPALTSVFLPENLQCLADESFELCKELTSISFSSHLQSIGDNAFSGCYALTSLNFQEESDNLTIGKLAFHNCTISEVELPLGTRCISGGAFSSCTNLTKLSIPETVKEVGNFISGCSNLKDLYCYATEAPTFLGTEPDFDISDIRHSATLHVKSGALSSYAGATWWSGFWMYLDDISTNIESVTLDNVKLTINNRHLSIEGLNDNDSIIIYNALGHTIYKGIGKDIGLNAPGIYFLKVKGLTKKFCVK